jgi:hypothetical protein
VNTGKGEIFHNRAEHKQKEESENANNLRMSSRLSNFCLILTSPITYGKLNGWVHTRSNCPTQMGGISSYLIWCLFRLPYFRVQFFFFFNISASTLGLLVEARNAIYFFSVYESEVTGGGCMTDGSTVCWAAARGSLKNRSFPRSLCSQPSW